MSDEGGGGKKSVGGHIAVGLAGIGALFARTADDCGRVALKGGAAVSDDAFRGASRVGSLADDGMRSGSKVGSLADDGMRAGKYGSAADDGMRAGKYGPLADDGMRNGTRVPPQGEGSLIEEATVASKAESHAGEAAEFGVDVSLEVISNVPSSDGADDSSDTPDIGGTSVVSGGKPKLDTMTLLRARSRVSQPALLPVVPASPKAFQLVLGRSNKPAPEQTFLTLRPTPDDGQNVSDPLKWLKGRLSHNPIALVFYTTDQTGTKNPIPLVLPNGGTTTDTIVHRACMEHFAHCVVLVCKPEKPGSKELCAKTVVDNWQTVTANGADMSLQSLLEKLVVQRATTVALHEVTISRLDLSQIAPRIVRSRLAAKKP
jgi:hypothetical protein